jgi:hypothetical protein
MTSDDLVKINKDYFVKVGESAAEVAVFSSFPFLSVQPFKFVTDQAINWVVTKIADGLELTAFFLYVDLRTSTEGLNYVQAAHKANQTQSEDDRKAADALFTVLVSFKS